MQSDLPFKYGPEAFDAGRALQPDTFQRRVEQRDALDQHFTKAWLDFAITGISQRGHMRGALRQGARPREVMEVCFQTAINFGMPPMLKALEVFVEVMAEEKRLDEIGRPALRVESYGK